MFGQSYGPGSRCLLSDASGPIARVDWGFMPPDSGCFPMACAAAPADATHLYGLRLLVTVAACGTLPCRDNTPQVAVAECPPGGFIELSSLGLGFTLGRLGPCPLDPRPYCAGLGCPGDCGGDRGVCVNPTGVAGAGTCVCNPGYIGPACGEVACTPAGCAGANASWGCNPLTGRCSDGEGRETEGHSVVETDDTAVALDRLVSLEASVADDAVPSLQAHAGAARQSSAAPPMGYAQASTAAAALVAAAVAM